MENTTDNTGNTPTDPRPLGFWLRVVDGLITREFATALAAEGVDRRDWMLLNVVDGDVDAPWLAARIARGGKRVRALADRGWLTETDGDWTLTDEGREAKERLGAIVDGVRERVSGAVSPDDYAITLRTLEAIAAELGWDAESMPDRGRFGRRRFGFGPRFGRGFGPGHGFDPRRGFGHGFGPGHDSGPHAGAEHGHGHGERRGFGPGHGHAHGERHGFGPDFTHHDAADAPCGRGHHRGHGRRHGADRRVDRLDAYERGFTSGFEKGRAAAS